MRKVGLSLCPHHTKVNFKDFNLTPRPSYRIRLLPRAKKRSLYTTRGVMLVDFAPLVDLSVRNEKGRTRSLFQPRTGGKLKDFVPTHWPSRRIGISPRAERHLLYPMRRMMVKVFDHTRLPFRRKGVFSNKESRSQSFCPLGTRVKFRRLYPNSLTFLYDRSSPESQKAHVIYDEDGDA